VAVHRVHASSRAAARVVALSWHVFRRCDAVRREIAAAGTEEHAVIDEVLENATHRSIVVVAEPVQEIGPRARSSFLHESEERLPERSTPIRFAFGEAGDLVVVGA
jgi:hypothetical protein